MLESACDVDCMVDDYEHISSGVIYTPVNIPGPGINPEDFDVQFMKGCDCIENKCCLENVCPCVEKFGMNYDENGRLLESKLNGPIVECNSLCSCSAQGKCGNLIVQLGPRKDLEIFYAGNSKGFGLKSKSQIQKGEFICEYAGEVITLDEAKRRSKGGIGNMNYIFVLNEYLSENRVIKTCVDPSVIGNIGRYINHSCQPNSLIVPVRTNFPIPKLCIFALKVIKTDEEITFDYGGGNVSSSTEIESGDRRKPCFCGTPVCKQFLPFDETIF
ncbi:Histone-lysine N-methyltransferase SETMAR [Blattella germanica]|nr:Histone-lysine N-methyltransferase SETMAR [Blattella germanica]